MALNEIIAHHGGVATGQFRRDPEPVFQRIEGVLIDILGLDQKSGLPDMIDPHQPWPEARLWRQRRSAESYVVSCVVSF